MSKELKYKMNNTGDCISEERMFNYIDNKLSPKEQHLVEKHLLDCELCSDALEGLRLVKNRKRIDALNDSVSSRIAGPQKESDYRLIISIAAGLLLLLGAFFIFNQYTKKEKMADLSLPIEKEKVIQKEEISTDSLSASSKPMETLETVPTMSGKNSEAKEQYLQKNISNTFEVSSAASGASNSSNEGIIADELATAKDDKYIQPDQNNDNSVLKNVEKETVISANQLSSPAAPAEKVFTKENTVRNNNTAESNDQDKIQGGYVMQSMSKSAKKSSEDQKEKVKAEEKNRSEKAAPTVAGNSEQGLAEKSNDISFSWTADSTIARNEKTYTLADEMPEFPGGIDALRNFITQNSSFELKNTADDIDYSLQLIISPEGKASQPKIPASIDRKKEKELRNLINKMPLWKPGRIGNKTVPVFFNLYLKNTSR